jgi:hypothetical protein
MLDWLEWFMSIALALLSKQSLAKGIVLIQMFPHLFKYSQFHYEPWVLGIFNSGEAFKS